MCDVLLTGFDKKDNQFFKNIFQEYFFNVDFLPDAKTAGEAYEIAQNQTIELLLLDISSAPEDEIFQVKTNIVRLQPNVKVILVDEKQNYAHLLTALRCGAIDYLVKPLDKSLCINAIHRAILALNQISLLDYKQASVTDSAKEGAHQMMTYIHKHYNEEISLEDLASFMHLNTSYISKVFKEVVGTPFSSYLRHYRIEQSKKLLVTMNQSIAEIASAVGFSDYAYFSRIFKKETGHTPTEYRENFTDSTVLADFNHVEGQYFEV